MAPSVVISPLRVDAALFVFAIVILTAAIAESILTQPSPLNCAAVNDRVAIQVAQLVGIILLLGFWTAQIESQWNPSNHFAVQFAATLFCALGVILRLSAIRRLGPLFQTDIVINTVVQDGIYRYFKHPSEIGLLIMAVSAPLIIGAIATSIVLALVLAPISVWRIRRENAVLSLELMNDSTENRFALSRQTNSAINSTSCSASR